ncbi:flagellar assembly protein FliW [Mesobacillus jeotgali]|uniref:flagellar assembly protein FliW n=1 Tax=Mesobacillus jeotgali TaxID=129985 RepID=UPI001CFEBE6E|nr:flagellar assembly protein FliW [Mesobacillus jeotgali]
MKVKTRYNGEVVIEKEKIIEFPSGIPGFPDNKKYFIVDMGDSSPFSILQSVDAEELGFVIVDPFAFYQDYEFELPDYLTGLLKIDEDNNILIYSIVTLGESLKKSTINLQSPIIINSKKKIGKQLIMNTDKYHTKHSLNKEIGQEG